MSQESCFWFMLNCTLNTEQCSCPLFILLQAAPTSHSHLQKIYTPTHHRFKEFEPSCWCTLRRKALILSQNWEEVYFWSRILASVVPTVHLLWDWAAAFSCDAFYWSTTASFPLNQRKFVEKESKVAVTHAKTIEKSLKLSVFLLIVSFWKISGVTQSQFLMWKKQENGGCAVRNVFDNGFFMMRCGLWTFGHLFTWALWVCYPGKPHMKNDFCRATFLFSCFFFS